MTRYTRGRDFEYRVRDYLRARGFMVVRSAGSKGPADLVAIIKHKSAVRPLVALIQCKRSGRMGGMEFAVLMALALDFGVAAYLAHPGEKGRGVVFVPILPDKHNRLAALIGEKP